MSTPIAEWTPQGSLTSRLVAQLAAQMWTTLAEPCGAVIISGADLRYRQPEGLAALLELLDEITVKFPHLHIWLCHLAPDLRAAISLGAVNGQWHIAPDRAKAVFLLQDHNNSRHSKNEYAAIR